MTDYRELNAMLRSIIAGVPHKIANLANASALLYEKLDRLNWAGFYLVENGKLVLNAFQGKVACIEIDIAAEYVEARLPSAARSSCPTFINFPDISPATVRQTPRSWCRFSRATRYSACLISTARYLTDLMKMTR